MQSGDYLFWIDLEMTGLDFERDTIIEVASVITNNNLEIIAEGPALVINQPDYILEGMDDWNRTHHGKSGLTAEVRQSHISLAEAYEETLNFARTYCKPKVVPLCGNSVYTDRAFMRRLMPDLDNYFNYRLIDVTTIKTLVKRWYPQDPCIYFEKETNHRARGDVFESIKELKHYQTHFFKQEPVE